ncbi:MAG: sensor histidine kinase [Alphaproteobacteria bacterium]
MTIFSTSRTIPASVIAGIATSARAAAAVYGPRAGTVARSLRAKLVFLALIFAAVPLILYFQFQNAYTDNQKLIEQSVAEQGRLVTRALTPLLTVPDGGPMPTSREFSQVLQQLTGGEIMVRILFSPATTSGAEGFFFVAANPVVSLGYLAQVRQELDRQGVLARLAPTCAGGIDESIRYATDEGSEEVLTSITPVNTSAGCWVVITSQATNEYRQSSLGVPYWMQPETRTAAAIYAIMAIVTLSLVAGIWRNLRRFGRLAQHIGADQTLQPSFADMNRVPELSNVALEFDRMVETLQHSAQTIRRAAEDNAHAFKTPIAVIRHCIEPLNRAVPDGDPRGRGALERITQALDRLDGLVSFARRMDNSEAALINPPRQQLDLSSFLQEVLTGYRQVVSQRRINLQLAVEDQIHIIGSDDLLETVLENLIDNALSFTPNGGWIGVSLQASGEIATMVIEDSGPGVPENDQERIFERYFSRRDETEHTRHHAEDDHLGLGLWIVRTHLSAIGGTIRAQTGHRGGLRLIVAIPLDPNRT